MVAPLGSPAANAITAASMRAATRHGNGEKVALRRN
jgi:hypothetical protein